MGCPENAIGAYKEYSCVYVMFLFLVCWQVYFLLEIKLLFIMV